jgi:hypothetical protein
MNEKKLSVCFEFTETGYLKAIFLNAENEKDQETLESALDSLLNPRHFNWIRRLFKNK